MFILGYLAFVLCCPHCWGPRLNYHHGCRSPCLNPESASIASVLPAFLRRALFCVNSSTNPSPTSASLITTIITAASGSQSLHADHDPTVRTPGSTSSQELKQLDPLPLSGL